MLAKLPIRELRAVNDAWLAADLDPASIAPLGHAVTRHRAIAEEARALAQTNPAASIAARLAAGEINFADAIFEHTAATGAAQPVSRSNKMRRDTVILEAANGRLRADATAFLRSHAHALLAEVDEASAKLKAVVDKLPGLAGVTSADDALKAGGKAPGSWQKLEELRPRQGALNAARSALLRFAREDRSSSRGDAA